MHVFGHLLVASWQFILTVVSSFVLCGDGAQSLFCILSCHSASLAVDVPLRKMVVIDSSTKPINHYCCTSYAILRIWFGQPLLGSSIYVMAFYGLVF